MSEKEDDYITEENETNSQSAQSSQSINYK